MSARCVGVLALQGAFSAHAETLAGLGVSCREVRTPKDLSGVEAIVIPGGESSTMSQLLESSGLLQPLSERLHAGMPALGTCAGMILLAAEIVDGRDDQVSLSVLDIVVRRNAYGRQVDSFEAGIDTVVGPFRGVFIRAPRIVSTGPGVEVLGRLGDEPVLVRGGNVLAASFHPELSGDARLHRLFLESAGLEGFAGEEAPVARLRGES
ncbi:MAG: pyridoxal 5'-phosphate synthase glutaminase subunit PdxT [Actinobacteria bacterium]|nr:pyridoxal 5'-phosphate synthase glutaminase subunit PdxT [Actinomycetota bacterium]